MSDLVKSYFSEPDFDAISDTVGKAEKSTSAEIAVRITSRSYAWMAERFAVGGVLALTGFFIALLLSKTSDWGTYYNYSQAVLWGIIGFVVGFAVDALIIQTKRRKEDLVWKRARQVFTRLKETSGKTGILVLLSLKERQAAIVVDEGVAEAIEADYWQRPLALIIKGMVSGDHAEGVIKAIDAMAAELKEKLPIKTDDEDELPDRPEIV